MNSQVVPSVCEMTVIWGENLTRAIHQILRTSETRTECLLRLELCLTRHCSSWTPPVLVFGKKKKNVSVGVTFYGMPINRQLIKIREFADP
jgi:hypothetical protein